MSHRMDQKKANRQIRREARKIAKRNEDLILSALKPKPRWIPFPVWLWGVSIFLEVKK